MTDIAYNVIKHPRELKQHPLNIEIYGMEVADLDLVESIKQKGMLEPIVIKEDNTILSGHRRWMAAKDLKLDRIPCRVIKFLDKDDEEESLIELYRKKLREIAILKKENFYEGTIGGFWYGNVKYYEYRYCNKFNEEFKERVRAYRGYICFECGCPQNGKALHVHHVHYDKKMCCNGSPQDIVPLCKCCHGHTQKNRDYWEDHFTELIYSQDPSGKCFFTKEEMKEFLNHKEKG